MSLGPERVSGQGILPEPVHATLPAAPILEAVRHEGDAAAGLPDAVAYSAYELGDRRFAWLHSPATVEGEGTQFFVVELRQSGEDWDVLDVDGHDSPEDALQAAARAWLIASGGPDVPSEPVADW